VPSLTRSNPYAGRACRAPGLSRGSYPGVLPVITRGPIRCALSAIHYLSHCNKYPLPGQNRGRASRRSPWALDPHSSHDHLFRKDRFTPFKRRPATLRVEAGGIDPGEFVRVESIVRPVTRFEPARGMPRISEGLHEVFSITDRRLIRPRYTAAIRRGTIVSRPGMPEGADLNGRSSRQECVGRGRRQ